MAPPSHVDFDDTVTDPWSELRRSIDQRLAELLAATDDDCQALTQAMSTSALAAGKRIRPIVLVLSARGLDCNSSALLDLGCAVELVHTASLILDDLPCMDNASMRRGEPSLHRRVGEDVATLSAVALLARAFACIASAPDLPPAIRTRMVGYLAEAVGGQGLGRGQYEDLRESSRVRPPHDVALTNHLKTGVLFEAALRMAALAAGANEQQEAALRHFARELGQAFQLFDDLTDGSTGNGKDAGQDAGKATLVALLGVEDARQRLARHLAEAERQLATVYGAHQPLRKFVAALFLHFDNALADLDGSRLSSG
ncbi:polyprenyl synthetase family protein [Hydrocarboniclastica marina]|uniref:Polyprenyl synthetase family protein n=1 Tax=Hydrocarboniclastica marina TaxID=2259620 RepID=A0A4P7XL46_9ALTE|nr:polyprenyl synthetase family protein [Hydrocarboniclastica marina]MAM00229.1 geranylgeranyl pyrophosphate synthase [Alteromonadaceae bacterium]QCF27563.1 polyprenyl synthetase family protein [Hydrocarboniclastica marina]|tara:strand:- start:1898 stop:2836 length:939 start_codon:yes stop_codon:yes gene_type:complete